MRTVVFGKPIETGLRGDDAKQWTFPFEVSDDDPRVKRRVTVRAVGSLVDPRRLTEQELVKVLFHFAVDELQRVASEGELERDLRRDLNTVDTPRSAFPEPSQVPEPEGFRLELADPPPRPLGFRP